MSEFEGIKYNINLKRDIKNFYNINKIFSFLDNKEKLKMIIYNKKLQKKFGVSIQDYKDLSGRYKIGEKNGKGKEYSLNTNNLIFVGEYLNGKRNGKGNEYYDKSKLIFEGEYIGGKRNGKGKEFYLNGVLKYEGKYLNGEKWDGKGYNIEGTMDLEIKDGRGKGKNIIIMVY